MLFFRPFSQVDKNDALFLFAICISNKNILFLIYQTETEIGSAGEQPIRVKFDGRQKVNSLMGCLAFADSPLLNFKKSFMP